MHWLDKYYTVGAVNEAARAKTVPALYAQILYILPYYYAAGFKPDNVLTYALAQTMLESDWMTSNVANVDNNYSGIMFINKPYQKNATKGLPFPANEGKAFYAHFPSMKEWAADFYRILNLNTGGKGKPIDASTAQQYVDRLKANHYFTSANYGTAFNAALKKVGAALEYGKASDKDFLKKYNAGQTAFTETAGKGLTSNAAFDASRAGNTAGHWVQDHKKPLAIAGAVVVVLLVVRGVTR